MQGRLFTYRNQFGVDIPDGEMRVLLKQHRPDVFLSHKSEDRSPTIEIARALASRRISAYVDYIDPQVFAENPHLESYLRDIIHNTKSMLAVVTARTISSWWVPFEIGVALDNDKLVGIILRGSAGQLPSYLLNWPVMESAASEVAEQWERYLMRRPRTVYDEWQQLSKASTRSRTSWIVV